MIGNPRGRAAPAGAGPLHRVPVGWKLAGLAVGGAVVVATHEAAASGVALAAVVVLAAASRRAWRPLARSMRGVLALAAVSTALQWWALGAARAADSALDVVVLALAAAVVAGTTSTNDILDRLVAWTSPARHLGADPDRAALVIALAIQALPAAQLLAVESRDAARARGIRSPRAHLAPFVVRVVALAHRTGEALLARGMTDPTADEDDKLAHVCLW